MHTIETHAGLVAYEEQGTGTPLILLHANTGVLPWNEKEWQGHDEDLERFLQGDHCPSFVPCSVGDFALRYMR